MEDALVQKQTQEVKEVSRVLILVLMEDALVQFLNKTLSLIFILVLILVLMEDALVLITETYRIT